jgi:hypothetical protein
MEKWNSGVFATTPGQHPKQNIFDEPVLIDNGHSDVIPVELTIGLWVVQRLYFGHMPVSKLSGFKDELSGKVINNAFTIGLLNPDEVEQGWLCIEPLQRRSPHRNVRLSHPF